MADTPQPDALPSAEPNPFAERLAADPSLGQVGLAERTRLNAVEAAYRGGISGSLDLADFKRALPDQYERITTDLARYEALRRFDGPMEGAAALAGQVAGSLTSPEVLLAPGQRLVAGLTERLLGGVGSRILGAGAGQATVQAVANPAIQASEIQSGLRKDYSPGETALAVAGGALLGGALHGAGEAVGAMARRGRPDAASAPKPKDAEVDAAIQARAAEVRQAEASNMAALAAEDPSLRSGSETTKTATNIPENITDAPAGGDRAEVGIPITERNQSLEPVTEASAMDAPAVVADPEAAAARAAVEVPALDRSPITRRTDGKPLSLTQFIARNGGLALDDEAAARDLGRIFIPGGGPLARERGRSIDGFWREALIEHGYLPADADGGAARNIERELFDAIDRERGGDRVYSQQDQAPVASEIDGLHREVEVQSKGVRKALKGVGIGDRETDPRTLTDAAELMVRGHETDPLAAYERAAMMRELADDSDGLHAVYGDEGRSFADEVQFRKARRDGEGAGAPGGDRGKSGREGGSTRPGSELPGTGESGIQFRRAADTATPRRLTFDSPISGERRITRAQAERTIIERSDQVEALRADPKTADRAAAIEKEVAALKDLLPKFDADLPRGRPFAPQKTIEAGDGFTVRVQDKGAERTYRIAEAGKDGKPGRPIGYVDMLQHEDGRWESQMLHVSPEHRGKGAASALYKAVESDIGAERVPSGVLLPDGYAFWKARDPEAVKFHQPFEDSYLSPRRIKAYLDSGAYGPEERAQLQAALDRVPPEGKTPEAMAVQFRKREATGGEPGRPGPPDGAAATTDAAGQSEPLRSLQQQAQALADALDVPLRQGRLKGGKDTLGQYDTGQDVARVRNVADFETVAHEAGHALEKRVAGLPALVQRFGAELGRLDYDPQAARPSEGFAEWMRDGMRNPATMQARAPAFSEAFRDLMAREAPNLLDALDAAGAAFRRYEDATGADQAAAIVRPAEREKVLRSLALDRLPSTIRMYLSRAYKTFFDDKTDVHKAVRQMARSIYQATGERVRLEGADNPENLVRLFARSQQAAIQDLSHGVRPWRQTVPEGPSLHDAIATATGKPSALGRWDEAAVKAFDDYLVMLRSDVLYRRFEAGHLPNRPVAMSAEKVRSAITEAEAANPGFRAGADQIHGFTRQLLRKQYEGGLIDAELYGRLMDEEFYVPLYRHMDDKPNAGSGAGGQDGPGTVDTVKRLKGSDRDVIPPTQSLITQTLLVNRTLQHNDIIRSLVALARQAREVGATGVGRLVEEIPATQLVGKKFDLSEAVGAAARQAGTDADDLAVLNGALADVFGEDPVLGTIFRAEPTGKRGEPITFYKDGGQLRAVRLSSEHEGLGLYEAVSSLPPGAQDIALKMLAYSSGVTRAAITNDPTFVVSNFVRDQMATFTIRPDYFPLLSGLRGVKSEVLQDKFAQMYVYGGGVSPGAGAAGLSELVNQDINALARKGWLVQKVGGLGDLMRGDVKGGFKALAEFAGTAESATRLSVFAKVFEQKKRQGLSDYDAMIESAAQATDLMDFGRHGSGTLYLRKLVPFINAWAQGIDKGLRRNMLEPLFRAATGDIVTEADAAALRNAPLSLTKFAAIGGGLGYLYGLWAAQYDVYHDADEKLRATHMIIPGAAFGLDPGTAFVIPKPFELALGFNLGELTGIHAATGDPRVAEWAVGSAKELLLPSNPLTSIPFQSTFIDLKQNKSLYTGRPIVSDREQNREHPELEFNERTSSFAKAVGKAIGISPIKVDYAIGSQFGSLGRNLVAATNAADPNAPVGAWYDTMFLRRWIKAADRTSQTTQQFWDAAAQLTGTYAQAKTYFTREIQNGHVEDALSYLGKLPAAQRAYVTLYEGGDEDSDKAVFGPDERRLHPIVRGGAAAQQVQNLIKELTANRVETFEGREPIKLNPDQRRGLIDSLRTLSAMEMQNALNLSAAKGYAGRPLLSTEDQFGVIKAMSPDIAAELATRYATNKILPTAMVAEFWPQAQKALLADGSQADIRDMALTAKSDGWAFGGDAVRKPQKRRIGIVPGQPPAATARASEPSATVPGPKNATVANPFQ